MVKILWLSRHSMTDEQHNDLVRIFGNIEITTYDSSVSTAENLLEIARDYQVIAAVLPIQLYVEYFKIKPKNQKVIFAVNKRISTGSKIINPATNTEEKEYKFVHLGWEEIKTLNGTIEKL